MTGKPGKNKIRYFCALNVPENLAVKSYYCTNSYYLVQFWILKVNSTIGSQFSDNPADITMEGLCFIFKKKKRKLNDF